MSKRPIHEIRYGLIKVSVWRNHTKSGERFSTSVVRLYKDGDTWRESGRFGRDDLLVVAKALSEAHTWIYAEGKNANGGTDK